MPDGERSLPVVAEETQANGNNLEFPSIRFSGEATVLNKPGAVSLAGYPLLVYAPSQHGPGIRTEDNGTPVHDICVAFAEHPHPEAIAERFGTTPDHVAEAVRYAAEAGVVTTGSEPTSIGS
jgi:hypothetical protein